MHDTLDLSDGFASHLRRPLRVLLCPDQPDWAFDNIAKNIMRFAPNQFEISKLYIGKSAARDFSSIFEFVASNDIDLVHFFWREDLFAFMRPPSLIAIADQTGLALSDVVEIAGSRAYTTSVYDHMHTTPERVAERVDSFHLIDSYSVSSNKLKQIYTSNPDLPNPDALITDGVDLELFHPRETEGSPRNPPVVGWVGNSNWGKSQKGDPKGYFRLFEPAIEILRGRGLDIQTHVADPQVNRIPFDQMPNYYREIDVLACTSVAEGTPNPVLEAMASGIPVVSTDVGIVPELAGPAQSQFVLKDPDAEKFANAIQNLIEKREQYQAVIEENLECIRSWSWEKRVQPWWSFWLSAYENARNPRLAQRRMFAMELACANHFHVVRVQQRSVNRMIGSLYGSFNQWMGRGRPED